MAQFDEALRYKSEGREFDSRWCHWNFSLSQSFRPHYGPGVDSASDRNEYREYFLEGKGGRCVGLKTLPLSCADCLEIWEPQTLGNFRACPGLYWDCFAFTGKLCTKKPFVRVYCLCLETRFLSHFVSNEILTTGEINCRPRNC